MRGTRYECKKPNLTTISGNLVSHQPKIQQTHHSKIQLTNKAEQHEEKMFF
jgi:hypothetical protein